MKHYIARICITALFSTIVLFAQAKPYWIDEIPDSNYFIYFRGLGVSTYKQDAQKKAVINALFDVAHYKNLQIDAFTESNQKTVSTNTEYYEYDETSQKIQLHGVGQDIVGLRIIAEYSNKVKGQYNYSVLVRLPKSTDSESMPIYRQPTVTPLFKSAILPGWGQFSKHDNKKAYLIVAAEGISLLSALSFKVIGDDFSNKSHNNSLSYVVQQNNRDNADTAYLYANIALFTAGIVYVYNIIDAISTNNNPMFTQNNSNPRLNFSLDKDGYKVTCMLRF